MEGIPRKWQHIETSWSSTCPWPDQTLSPTLAFEKHKREKALVARLMSDWFDLPPATWNYEESWPKTPTTTVDTTSPCFSFSVTTLVLDQPKSLPLLPKKKHPIFKFTSGTIISAPEEPLCFKYAEGIYQFLFRFQNKLLIKETYQHAIKH